MPIRYLDNEPQAAGQPQQPQAAGQPQQGNIRYLDNEQQPGVLYDTLATIPSSGVRAFTDTSGLFGTLDNTMRQLGTWGARKIAPALGLDASKIPDAPQTWLPTIEGENAAVERAVGQPLYEPKYIPGKIMDRGIRLVPAAASGGGSVPARLALGAALPAAAGVLAGEGARKLGASETVAKGADILASLLAPLAATAVGKSIQTTIARGKQVPTTQNLYDAKERAYSFTKDVHVDKQAFKESLGRMRESLGERGLDLRQKNASAANLLEKMYKVADDPNEPLTLGRLQGWRQILGKEAGSQRDSFGVAGAMYEEANNFLRKGLTPDMLSGKNADKAIPALRLGDELYRRYKNSQTMDSFYKIAKNKRGANYSQAGEATGLKQKFAALSNEISKPDSRNARYFNPTEIGLIDDVAQGNIGTRALRTLAAWNPTSGKGAAATGLGGYFGGPVGAAIAAAPGGAAWLGYQALTKRAANRAADFVRLGHPLNIPNELAYPSLLPPLTFSQLAGENY